MIFSRNCLFSYYARVLILYLINTGSFSMSQIRCICNSSLISRQSHKLQTKIKNFFLCFNFIVCVCVCLGEGACPSASPVPPPIPHSTLFILLWASFIPTLFSYLHFCPPPPRSISSPKTGTEPV